MNDRAVGLGAARRLGAASSLGAAVRLGLGSVALSGCVLISDFDIHQCNTDDDCAASADAPARICDAAQARCVPGCRDHAQCVTALGEVDAFCPERGQACVNLYRGSEACFGAILPARDENTGFEAGTGASQIVLGLFAPDLDYRPTAARLTYELVIRELNETGGLPGPAGSRLPVAGVLCSDAPAQTPAALRHLTATLGVRAVLAGLEPTALRSALTTEYTPADTLFINPFPASSVAVESPALWHLLGQPGPTLRLPYRRLIAGALQHLSSSLGVAQNELRVASVIGSDAASIADQELHDVATSGLTQAASGALFSPAQSRDFALRSAAEFTSVAAAVSAFAPHLVLLFASRRFDDAAGTERSSVVAAIEAQWSSAAARPHYVLSPRNLEDDAITTLAEDAAFRERTVGLNYYLPLDDALSKAFESSYGLQFANGNWDSASANVYDATYLLAYASAAARLQGSDIASGLRSVTTIGGTGATVGGSEARNEVFRLLAAGTPLTLSGITGPFDFDPVSHARPTLASPYCLTTQPSEAGRGSEVVWDTDEWVFDAARSDFARLDLDVSGTTAPAWFCGEGTGE